MNGTMLFILDSSRIEHSLPLEPFFTKGRYFFHLLTRLSLVRGKQPPAVRTVGIVALSIHCANNGIDTYVQHGCLSSYLLCVVLILK